MTSYRLRFWNINDNPKEAKLPDSSRAWLLTVYGFETFLYPLHEEFRTIWSCMTSYRLRFWNPGFRELLLQELYGSRAWLLTVYGFETPVAVAYVKQPSFSLQSCMTSYRLRFWNCGIVSWTVDLVYVVHDFLPFTVLKLASMQRSIAKATFSSRAWLLTVYGFQENKKHLSIAGSAFLIRGEDDKKNTATLSRNGWKNFFVIVQVFIPPQKQTNEPNSDESPNSGMNPIIVTSQKVQRSDASTIEPASTKPITNHGIYIHLFSSSTLIPC